MSVKQKKDIIVINNNDVKGKQYLLMESLSKYYNIPGRINIVYDIINQKTILSLRILDWLVTNYAKSKNVMYELEKIGCKNKEETYTFNIFLNYKTQLKAYSKKQFDPFCRRERVDFEITTCGSDNKLPCFIKTTIGQLNFFRWAIQNNIIDYAINNIKDIEYDMINSIKHRKGYIETTNITPGLKKRGRKSKFSNMIIKTCVSNTSNNKKKRKELSISATKTFTKINSKIIVEFN
tara:strand:- start:2277 stop:2984 length:708 start_codon:yes stop_codon:yes gene_type:complete